jgi:hypothetical protein
MSPNKFNTYMLPSGPSYMSVIVPKPLPNTIPPVSISEGLFAILSAEGFSFSKNNDVRFGLTLKLYKKPRSESPIKIES